MSRSPRALGRAVRRLPFVGGNRLSIGSPRGSADRARAPVEPGATVLYRMGNTAGVAGRRFTPPETPGALLGHAQTGRVTTDKEPDP